MPGGTFRGMQGYLQLMEQCWSEDIGERPTCENVIISLRGLLERATANQRDLQKTLTGKRPLCLRRGAAWYSTHLPHRLASMGASQLMDGQEQRPYVVCV